LLLSPTASPISTGTAMIEETIASTEKNDNPIQPHTAAGGLRPGRLRGDVLAEQLRARSPRSARPAERFWREHSR